MDHLIKDIIELDKQARLKVEELIDEKSKIGDFLRSKNKELEQAYKEEAKEKLEEVKNKMSEELAKKKEEIQKEYSVSLSQLEDYYNAKKDEWIDSIFSDCIKEI